MTVETSAESPPSAGGIGTGAAVGVGAGIGAGGVERIVEIELNAAERAAFDKSAEAVRQLCQAVQL